MKLVTKLMALTGIVATAILLDRKRREQSRGRFEADQDDLLGDEEGVVDAEILIGIAEIDPESMTQISGEGIDEDANAAAHEPRKNIP